MERGEKKFDEYLKLRVELINKIIKEKILSDEERKQKFYKKMLSAFPFLSLSDAYKFSDGRREFNKDFFKPIYLIYLDRDTRKVYAFIKDNFPYSLDFFALKSEEKENEGKKFIREIIGEMLTEIDLKHRVSDEDLIEMYESNQEWEDISDKLKFRDISMMWGMLLDTFGKVGQSSLTPEKKGLVFIKKEDTEKMNSLVDDLKKKGLIEYEISIIQTEKNMIRPFYYQYMERWNYEVVKKLLKDTLKINF